MKLALFLGAVLGWYGWRTVVIGAFAGYLLAALYGVGLILTRRAGRQRVIPFGPFVPVGMFTGVLLGSTAGSGFGCLFPRDTVPCGLPSHRGVSPGQSAGSITRSRRSLLRPVTALPGLDVLRRDLVAAGDVGVADGLPTKVCTTDGEDEVSAGMAWRCSAVPAGRLPAAPVDEDPVSPGRLQLAPGIGPRGATWGALLFRGLGAEALVVGRRPVVK